jgi:hypothetical protein
VGLAPEGGVAALQLSRERSCRQRWGRTAHLRQWRERCRSAYLCHPEQVSRDRHIHGTSIGPDARPIGVWWVVAYHLQSTTNPILVMPAIFIPKCRRSTPKPRQNSRRASLVLGNWHKVRERARRGASFYSEEDTCDGSHSHQEGRPVYAGSGFHGS